MLCDYHLFLVPTDEEFHLAFRTICVPIRGTHRFAFVIVHRARGFAYTLGHIALFFSAHSSMEAEQVIAGATDWLSYRFCKYKMTKCVKSVLKLLLTYFKYTYCIRYECMHVYVCSR